MSLTFHTEGALGPAAVGLSGGPASTEVLFQFVMPSGFNMELPATTDSSGDANVTFVPQAQGDVTVTVVEVAPSVIAGPTTTPIE